MDLARYGEWALDLVNSDDPFSGTDRLTDLDGLRSVLPDSSPWWRDAATEQDLRALRSLREELRRVFEVADDAEAVALLDDLLARTPVQPTISGHDAQDWHLHLAPRGRSVAEEFAASAVFGLTLRLLDVGWSRRGVCDAAPCTDVFVDTSRNRSRRYCSTTCTTRANVARHRARQRAAASDTPDAPTTPDTPDAPTTPDPPDTPDAPARS